jgi:hypothetical protein
MIKKFRCQSIFATRFVIRLKSRTSSKAERRPEHQSTYAGDRASAEVISNTSAANHESVVQF